MGHRDGDTFALLLNSAANGVEFTVPKAPAQEWRLSSSSDPGQDVHDAVTTLIVRDSSFTLLRSHPERARRPRRAIARADWIRPAMGMSCVTRPPCRLAPGAQ